MKFLFRWLFRMVVLLLLLGVALLLFKDAILEELTEQRLTARTGLEIRIDRLEMAFLRPTITLEGFRVYNPAEFGGGPFLDLRELHLEYDPVALAKGKVHLRLLRVDLEELCLVRHRDGTWNFQAINEQLKSRTPADRSPLMDFGGIDVLNLSVGRVKRFDLDTPHTPRILRFDLRDELFTNLRTPSDYVVALSRLVFQLGIKSLIAPTNGPSVQLPAG